MPITDQTIEHFREEMKERYGEDLSFAEAKGRYLELLNFFWLLSYEPPKGGESRDVPSPPWI
jgi:hypothetical protein